MKVKENDFYLVLISTFIKISRNSNSKFYLFLMLWSTALIKIVPSFKLKEITYFVVMLQWTDITMIMLKCNTLKLRKKTIRKKKAQTWRSRSIVISVLWRSNEESCKHVLNSLDGRDFIPLLLRCKACIVFTNVE